MIYFVVVYHWLAAWSAFAVDIWGMVRLVILSLAGFGFYRVFFGVMLLKYRGRYFFFGDQGLPKPLLDTLEHRDLWQEEALPHLVPGFVWVGMTIVLASWWTR